MNASSTDAWRGRNGRVMTEKLLPPFSFKVRAAFRLARRIRLQARHLPYVRTVARFPPRRYSMMLGTPA